MTWVIVGLGNPGSEYDRTRHNAGRESVTAFARATKLSEWKEDKKKKLTLARGLVGKDIVVALLPDTFMNRSGSAVSPFVKSVKAAERLVVAYDDMDLPLGMIKIAFDRGSGGHRGLESVIRAVKTKKFVRVRIGVSPTTASGKLKKPQGEKEVVKFILAKFKPAEVAVMRRSLDRAADALEAVVMRGYLSAMNEFNRG